jgi:hypothetical protein
MDIEGCRSRGPCPVKLPHAKRSATQREGESPAAVRLASEYGHISTSRIPATLFPPRLFRLMRRQILVIPAPPLSQTSTSRRRKGYVSDIPVSTVMVDMPNPVGMKLVSGCFDEAACGGRNPLKAALPVSGGRKHSMTHTSSNHDLEVQGHLRRDKTGEHQQLLLPEPRLGSIVEMGWHL